MEQIDSKTDWEIEFKKYRVQEQAQNISERKKYAQKTFNLVISFLLTEMLILVSCGFGMLHLSDTILSVLLTTTTIQVCGFFLFVVKYLFGNKG